MSATTSTSVGSAASSDPSSDAQIDAQNQHAIQGAVIGLIVGALVLIFMVIGTVLLVCCKRRQHRRQDATERQDFERALDQNIRETIETHNQLPPYSPPEEGSQQAQEMQYHHPQSVPPPPPTVHGAQTKSNDFQQHDVNTYAFPPPEMARRTQDVTGKPTVYAQDYELAQR